MPATTPATSWARSTPRSCASCARTGIPAGLEWGLHTRREALIEAELTLEGATPA